METMRCDIKPMGYSIVAGGSNTSNLSSWKCQNSSLSQCSWSPFWTVLPKNTSFEGKEYIDGKLADKWTYWLGGEKWALWATLAPEGSSSSDVPVAYGKIFTATPGFHLWHVVVHDFKAVPPNVSDFAVDPRIHCPSSSVATFKLHEGHRSTVSKSHRHWGSL